MAELSPTIQRYSIFMENTALPQGPREERLERQSRTHHVLNLLAWESKCRARSNQFSRTRSEVEVLWGAVA